MAKVILLPCKLLKQLHSKTEQNQRLKPKAC